MRVGIVGQRGNQRAASLVGDIADRLQQDRVDVVVDDATHAEFESGTIWDDSTTRLPDTVPVEDFDSCDLVVSVGGDGTFLFAARGAGGTPIMGINLGEVGFLNAISPEQAVETVAEEVTQRRNGRTHVREMPRIRAESEEWSLSPALNEVVVQGPQRGHGNGITVEIRVDGSLYTSDHADGVLVATTTGSTAYNLSEGGPLVHPDVSGFLITEMCDREEMPSLMVDVDATISVQVSDAESAVAVSDGRVRESVTPPAEIRLERAKTPVRVAGPPLDFFTALEKLE